MSKVEAVPIAEEITALMPEGREIYAEVRDYLSGTQETTYGDINRYAAERMLREVQKAHAADAMQPPLTPEMTAMLSRFEEPLSLTETERVRGLMSVIHEHGIVNGSVPPHTHTQMDIKRLGDLLG